MAFKDPVKIKVGNQMALALLYLGLACFLVCLPLWIIEFDLAKETLPSQGGVIGPVAVSADKKPITIRVEQPLQTFDMWSNVEIAVYDGNKKYLFNLGMDMYREQGSDSEGHWEENMDYADVSLLVPKAGDYYFELDRETNRKDLPTKMTVTLSSFLGSSQPFLILMGIALGFSLVLFFITNVTWQDFVDG